MVKLTTGRMKKRSENNKLSRTALQVFKINFFRLGKRKPVHQLKKAGGILVLLQQILNAHASRKDN